MALSDRRAELEELGERALRETGTPGMTVGIMLGDEDLTAGFGVTNLDNPLPVTPDTLFQIGSTSKTVTGLIVMQLVEEGKLDLDQPIRTYLPELTLKDPVVNEGLTLRHCLTHTGGFDGDYFCDFGRGEDALAQAVASMRGLNQITPLGEVWSYCNSGFYIAGRVIEVITGSAYESVATARVLKPLGMNRSFYFPEDVMTFRFASGHATIPKPHVVRPWGVPRVVSPVGGIISDVTDNLRYARFMMGDGMAADGSRVIASDTLRTMMEPAVPSQDDEWMGLTWHLYEIDGVRVIRHGGATNGQVSSFLFVPERQFALAVLTNAGRRDLLDTIRNWALKEILGLVRQRPTPAEATREQLVELVGTYETIATIARIHLQDGSLVVESELKPDFQGLSDEAPPKLSPDPIALTGPDGIIVTDGMFKGTTGDIVRRDGAVRWIRMGGRLLTKVS